MCVCVCSNDRAHTIVYVQPDARAARAFTPCHARVQAARALRSDYALSGAVRSLRRARTRAISFVRRAFERRAADLGERSVATIADRLSCIGVCVLVRRLHAFLFADDSMLARAVLALVN